MSISKIVNETGLHPALRIRVSVSLPYDCDLDKAEKTLFLTLSTVKEVLESPEPRVRFREFADSAVKAEIMGWIKKPADKGFVTHELVKQVHADLKKAKILIPYPQMDVHIKK